MPSTLHLTEPAAHVAMLIDELGHSADEVADMLETHGIKGVRNTVRFMNPLVRYLLDEFQAEFQQRVFMDVMRGDVLRMALLSGEKQEVALPDGVVDFLIAFDQGLYPQLEES